MSRDNNAGIGCLLGGFLGPIGLIVALVLRGNGSDAAARLRHEEQIRVLAASVPPPAEPGKVCPRCAETVKQAANLCRFCQYSFAANGEPTAVLAAHAKLAEPKHAQPPERAPRPEETGRGGAAGQVVVNFLTLEFARENSIDVRDDKLAVTRLHEAAEKAITELTSSQDALIELPFLSGTRHLKCRLTRSKLDELMKERTG